MVTLFFLKSCNLSGPQILRNERVSISPLVSRYPFPPPIQKFSGNTPHPGPFWIAASSKPSVRILVNWTLLLSSSLWTLDFFPEMFSSKWGLSNTIFPLFPFRLSPFFFFGPFPSKMRTFVDSLRNVFKTSFSANPHRGALLFFSTSSRERRSWVPYTLVDEGPPEILLFFPVPVYVPQDSFTFFLPPR